MCLEKPKKSLRTDRAQFVTLTVANTHRSLAKRAYCLRVKTVLKSRGSSPHGPVSASRGKGLEEVVGWMRCVLDCGHHFAV